MTGAHRFDLAVRSSEIDGYGHVNNAVYQQWFEEGREGFLRLGGRDYDWYPAKLGLLFVVARVELDFRAAARRGERGSVTTALVRIGEKSVTFAHRAVRDDGMLWVEGRTVMCWSKDGRAVRVPDDFRSLFATTPSSD
jgi:YbgC/YbaW family acyl-CoA thioester hydrolase